MRMPRDMVIGPKCSAGISCVDDLKDTSRVSKENLHSNLSLNQPQHLDEFLVFILL